jgi:hypothetical protein
MTAQINDSVSFEGRTYSIVGENGSGLFDPEALGFHAVALHTACWRGFYCTYAVRGRRLELDELHIRLAPPEPAVIFGKRPKTASKHGDAVYEDMGAPIEYTGGLLIADDFIEEMYVHMGFHPPYKYRVVHELIFDEGRLTSATDQSDVMEKVRESLRGRPLQPDHDASEDEIEKWIEGTFSLKYW